jgi:hypothetical protein
MSVRTCRAPYLVLAFLVAGLAGCTHNPSSFPYYLPGGPVKTSHAKPRFGYFADFDPRAYRLEVTPRDATAPLGSHIVLVATVYDEDGDPRRSRRVEWVLEGPGSIVEVDESGFSAGRGYKVDNKYAVSNTNLSGRTITRGNDDPKDDVEITAGQTFCVISSAVPGETTVTAYAPAVHDWEKGRVIARIVWGEGRYTFPPPAVARYGSEHLLSTSVRQLEEDGGLPAGYRVRYRLLEGNDAPAILVSRNGAGTSGSQSGTSAREAEAIVDANGTAAVRLLQPSPKPGKTRVAVEIVKPPEDGVGPGKVVSRRETIVEWVAPAVMLDVKAPPVAANQGSVPVTVSLANTGPVESRESRVRVVLSDGATLERSEPPPTRQDGTALVFDLPPVEAGKKQEVALQVHPARLGQFTVTAEVATADGLEAKKDATVRVESGKLSVLVDPPPTALAGETALVRVAVTNAGAAPARNVTVFAQFDDRLRHVSGKNPVEQAVGSLDPGQTQTVDLPLAAAATGRYTVRATVTADGKLTASAAPVIVDVRKAELKVAVTGPKLVYLNQDFAWTLSVGNAGDGPVSNVVVRATLPPEVTLKDADGGSTGAGSIEWKVAELKPGEQRSFRLSLGAANLADRAAIAVAALADVGARDAIQAKGEAAVAIIGTPALVLELATPPGPVEVGKRTSFTVRVRNQGTVAARNVDVAVVTPSALRAIRGTGRVEGRIESDGKIVFPPIKELPPGQAATFTIEVEGAQPGTARLHAEVRAPHLTQVLKEEQTTRVTEAK